MEIGLKLMVPTNKNSDILTHTYLSIQIRLSGLSFCILEGDSNNISFLKHLNFEKKELPFKILEHLKHAFQSINELQTQFKSVTVLYENDLSTLVPKALFNEDHLANYLKFNAKILKSDFIAYDDIQINESVNVYVPYVNINNYIYEKFGSFSYKHFSTVLIEQILSFEKNADDSKMYVNVSKAHFEIITVHKGKLQLYNTFEYQSKEDFIYYILFTIEQLQHNPELIQLILLGNIQLEDDLYQIAYKYIRHVKFGSRNDSYSYAIEPTSDYSYFTLINSF